MEATIKAPKGAIESLSAYFWLDADGVLIIMNKPKDVHSGEDALENVKFTQSFCNDVPRLLLIDVTKIRSMTREAREMYKMEGSTGRILAVALVTSSLAGRILANFFLNFNKPEAPTRLFNNYNAAHTWLLSIKKEN